MAKPPRKRKGLDELSRGRATPAHINSQEAKVLDLMGELRLINSPEVAAKADEHWSIGALTLPHMLVRLIVAEQLYRAASLLANHPYHRA